MPRGRGDRGGEVGYCQPEYCTRGEWALDPRKGGGVEEKKTIIAGYARKSGQEKFSSQVRGELLRRGTWGGQSNVSHFGNWAGGKRVVLVRVRRSKCQNRKRGKTKQVHGLTRANGKKRKGELGLRHEKKGGGVRRGPVCGGSNGKKNVASDRR